MKPSIRLGNFCRCCLRPRSNESGRKPFASTIAGGTIMAEKVSPARLELLALKTQIALAQQGRDLLKEKRKAIMQEFMGVAAVLIEKGEALERSAAVAR